MRLNVMHVLSYFSLVVRMQYNVNYSFKLIISLTAVLKHLF